MDKLVELIFKKLEWLPSSIGNIVGGVAAIGALFYVGHRVWQSMTKGEPIDPYPLLRPVVAALLIFAFPTLVITPIHYILSPTRTATAQMVYNRKDINKAKIEEFKQKIEEQRNAKAALEDEEESLWESLKGGARKVFSIIGDWLLEKLLWLIELVRALMAMFFKLLRIVFLVILGCIGPIALAMSLFPSYENSFGGWLSKYIGIYMWLPLCNILEIIGQEIEVQVMSAMLAGSAFPQETGLTFILILMSIVIVIAYLQIPDMAGWIIQGGSITLQGMMPAMTMIGGWAGAAAGAAAGYGARKTGLSTMGQQFKQQFKKVKEGKQ